MATKERKTLGLICMAISMFVMLSFICCKGEEGDNKEKKGEEFILAMRNLHISIDGVTSNANFSDNYELYTTIDGLFTGHENYYDTSTQKPIYEFELQGSWKIKSFERGVDKINYYELSYTYGSDKVKYMYFTEDMDYVWEDSISMIHNNLEKAFPIVSVEEIQSID